VVIAVLAGAWFAWEAWRIELRVDSTPPGAVVRIDGERAGTTPARIALVPGRHLVALELDGFARESFTVEVERGDREVHTFVLEAGTGRLSLLSNPRGAWVELDGERVDGVTPLELEYRTGPVEVRMGLPERRPRDQRVIVLDGETTELRLELARDPHGELRVRVTPADATVRLPDLDVAYTPGVRVPVGEHVVEVARRGWETRRIRFRVREGRNRATVDLVRAEADLTVRVRPEDAAVTVTWLDAAGAEVRRPWRAGLRAPVGVVEVRARALGYRTGYRRVDHGRAGSRVDLALERMDVEAGSRFRDPMAGGGEGPLMVVVPAGRFVMGDAAGPESQRPATVRTLSQPFAMAAFEVSVAEWRRFAAATGVTVDERLQTPEAPVRYVDHDDAVAYTDWLTAETGVRYRLPTEAEWEYAARAGTEGSWHFGDDEAGICTRANLADASARRRYELWMAVECDDGFEAVAPVGSFPANPFGLHDVLGNVSEWVLECGMPPYADADDDGSLVNRGERCSSHGHRGGSWDGDPAALSVTRRAAAFGRKDDVGIRLVREL
jgi:formylglycine-generating enzyme required for sulfatase activity